MRLTVVRDQRPFVFGDYRLDVLVQAAFGGVRIGIEDILYLDVTTFQLGFEIKLFSQAAREAVDLAHDDDVKLAGFRHFGHMIQLREIEGWKD